ncbi:MAG: hypothetical protein NC826_05335 [Candidatus Omnitrophica bacterium]|nr:hypothetical protein [Candidatus Omnitrophota bacterium]
MSIRLTILWLMVGVVIILSTTLLFCQEELIQEDVDYLWVWGEVMNVDIQNKVINIKYLDYETDTEKELYLVVDNKTTYEGVNSLLEIRPSDIISVDYVAVGDKNIARNISVEKYENVISGATSSQTGSSLP